MLVQIRNGNLTAFSGANAITGQTSSAAATPNTSNSTTTNGVNIQFWLFKSRISI